MFLLFFSISFFLFFFFFNDTATTEIYTLSLHDALPISARRPGAAWRLTTSSSPGGRNVRSEEHTSELQSRENLVCRLLLEKKKKIDLTGVIEKKETPAADRKPYKNQYHSDVLRCRPDCGSSSTSLLCLFFFFFNDTATTEIYTLSLHDALPISTCDSVASIRRLSAPSRAHAHAT